MNLVEDKFSVSKPALSETQFFLNLNCLAIDFNIECNLFWTMLAFMPWDALDPFISNDAHRVFNDIYNEIRYLSYPNFFPKQIRIR